VIAVLDSCHLNARPSFSILGLCHSKSFRSWINFHCKSKSQQDLAGIQVWAKKTSGKRNTASNSL